MSNIVNIEAISKQPNFNEEEINLHIELLMEKVFQTETKWPHFNLLLKDIHELAKSLPTGSTVVSFERGLLYGGVSLLAPIFSGHNVIATDCSPESANNRGAYNEEMVNDERLLRVESSLRTQIEDTGLPEGIADLITVPNLVHHISDQNALFLEITRVLKPGGKAYIFEPLVRELHQSPDDFLRYTPFGLEEKFRRYNLNPIQTKTEGGPFSVIAYCWSQALEYFSDPEREEMKQWFYNKHFKELLKWDDEFIENQERNFTSFPMAFSVLAEKTIS